MRVVLETTLEDFEGLHLSITARCKSVSVPITTLNRLLVDHSRMVRTLEGLGVTVSDSATAMMRQGSGKH